MKIISIGPAYPYRGGLATFNDRLALEFIKEGTSIEIYTFSLQYPSIFFPGKTQLTDGIPPERITIYRRINSMNPVNWFINGSRIRREKPDILLLRFWLPLLGPCFTTIAAIASRNRHTKVICIFDNVVPHERRPGDRFLTKMFVKSIDGAIVMSQTVLDDLREFSSSIPVKLTPHPIFDNYGSALSRAEALEALGLADDCRYMLFFGFIREYKGLDLLLDALADKELLKRNIKLLVAGEFYEDPAPYHKKIADNGLSGKVILFDHFIKDNQVPAFFCASDIVIQPYRTATQSGVTQIAYYFEKPMIVTDVGGLSEIVVHGKCGYVVKPDPSEIATAIRDFFGNDRNEEFTAGVKDEKHRFSWSKMTAGIVDVYKKILNKENR